MVKLLTWLVEAIEYLSVGPAFHEPKDEPNPLIRTQIGSENDKEPIREPIEPRVILNRTRQLVDNCNLQDYENHFMLAAAMLISVDSWKDQELRTDTRETLKVGSRALDDSAKKEGRADEETDESDKITESEEEDRKVEDETKDRIKHRRMTDLEYKSFEKDQCSFFKKLWRQPWAMKQLMLLCGLGSMIQGWDEAAINGAQVYFKVAYGLEPSDPKIGFINGAPYICCFISCWLSWPLNKFWGRRATVFFAALCCIGFAIGQSFADNWSTMLIFRIFLGLGIGPKSATMPIYASEVAPANLRGALVMMWQLFTALGIMFGYLSVLWFANKGDGDAALLQKPPCKEKADLLSLGCSLNWRLMIGSPMVAPILLCLYIFFQPESPRWLIARAQRKERANKRLSLDEPIDLESVFSSLVRLRGGNKLKAARDMIIIDVLLWNQKEEAIRKELAHQGIVLPDVFSVQDVKLTSRTKYMILEKGNMRSAWEEFKTLYSKRRNRNALIASTIVMFLQQYCGINVLIYYSTLVLFQTTDNGSALYPDSAVPKFVVLSSIIGGINFLCGLPAIFLIDQRGRRHLLLRTFPLLGIFAALVAIGNMASLSKSQARDPLILAGMYLFVIFYSSGEGPVPFVYASESFPQDIRDLGMSMVTSINWILNFGAAVSFPSMSDTRHMGLSGTFAFYSGMCFVGFILVFLFVPETCQKELEQLDEVFDQSLLDFAHNNLKELWRSIRRRRNRMIGRPPFRREESSLDTGSPGKAIHVQQSSKSQEVLSRQGPEGVQVRSTSPVRKSP